MRRLLITLLFLLPALCFATDLFSGLPEKQLSADKAFNLTLHIASDQEIVANWQIKSGFMLYQNRIAITTNKDSSAHIGTPSIPRNDSIQQLKIDGHPVFSFYANAYIPIKNKGDGKLSLSIQYQGCKGKDYCYPPIRKIANINLNTGDISIKNAEPILSDSTSDQTTALFQKSTWLVILSFFGLGLALSFTPCVLPMLPIIWKIIVGHDHNVWHALLHGALYALSMAIGFSILGILAASIGHSLQAAMQNFWLISVFSLIILYMALTQFDILQLNFLQKIAGLIQSHQKAPKAGSLISAISMGVLSSLVLSPCISAPLIAALLYIANTGNIALGGSSLFALAIGMNVPLLAVAIVGLKVLPKTGGWMNTIKHLSGFVLLILAIWIFSRVIPPALTLTLYGILAIIVAIYCYRLKFHKRAYRILSKIATFFALIYALCLFIGAYEGHNNPLQPLTESTQLENIITVTTEKSLNQYLKKAALVHQAVIIDFYADWCVACQEMERDVFEQADIQAATKPLLFLRVDMTHSTPGVLAIAKQYQVFAPPSLVFYNTKGVEEKSLQIFGNASKMDVLNHIRMLNGGDL